MKCQYDLFLMVLGIFVAPALTGAAELRRPSIEDLRWLEHASLSEGGGADLQGPLVVIQTAYSHPENGNATLLLWGEGSQTPNGVNIYVDGERLGTLPAPGLAFVTELEIGKHVFRVEEADVPSPTFAEGALTILAFQPFDDPSDLQCVRRIKEDSETCAVSVAWRNASNPPGYYLLLLDDEEQRTGSGETSQARFTNIEEGSHELTLIGFSQAEAGNSLALYRGTLIQAACNVGDCKLSRFVRGVCDGNGSIPRISSAIFALSSLFLGGAEPPCMAACDADGDASFTITDPIFVLNFLFLGGPAPSGWEDKDQNGVKEPVCQSATANSCAEPHAFCE